MTDLESDSKPKIKGRFVLKDKHGNIKQEGTIEPKVDIRADSVDELLEKLEKVEEELEAVYGAPVENSEMEE
jgi:hypothetical protein